MTFTLARPLYKPVAMLLIACLLLGPISSIAQEKQPQKKATEQAPDYYYQGLDQAQRDYTGVGAVVGGLAAGFGLGLIGWGIGFAVVSSMDVEVPHEHVIGFTTQQRLTFEQGYTKGVKKARKQKFNIGAGIGTAIIVIIVASSGGE